MYVYINYQNRSFVGIIAERVEKPRGVGIKADVSEVGRAGASL